MSAAVTESRRPLQAAVIIQGAGGGRDSGRYTNNAMRQDASTPRLTFAFAPCNGRTRWPKSTVLFGHVVF
jgi:hypothetical protein